MCSDGQKVAIVVCSAVTAGLVTATLFVYASAFSACAQENTPLFVKAAAGDCLCTRKQPLFVKAAAAESCDATYAGLASAGTPVNYYYHCMQTDLAVAQVIVVLYIGQQDAAQLLQAVASCFMIERLLPVGAQHVLVHPTPPFSPLGIPADN